ncbi:glycosyltransferase family 61 protein [Cellulomonas sp. zg-ZUI22]|uniref:glycosyltransferase 61 family protein n=1 Tax=Cellulomonas sp. zg-ZUI22 TaxID=2816955 RepID=UPI001A947A6D|nr:glycosyltransferase family 61 protein [Cellulomonas sp. zg-ZUI22]MBO0901202.1 glycosyltransferase family 61 protein [Cellulomonas sp. zg-ZUI22]
MSLRTNATPFFLIDRRDATLIVSPALAGIEGRSRVAIYDHDARRYSHVTAVAAGGVLRLALRDLLPLDRLSIKLQTPSMSDGSWKDHAKPDRLSALGPISVETIAPATWGVAEDCWVTLRDTYTGTEILRCAVSRGGEIEFVLDGDDSVRRIQLDFFAQRADGGVGPRLLPPIRLAPASRRGQPPEACGSVHGDLRYSCRRNVTLAPTVLKSSPRGGLATFGFLGAWEGDEPIVEAMEFVLGRQRYHYQPTRPEPASTHGRAIYLGLPHGSWGHFLTQGLARIWYALLHPEVPVIWDAAGLEPFQQHVLQLIGMRNPQHFLTKPMAFDEVVFPFPGISLGDYVLTSFTDMIGCVPASTTVPGKKLFISRSGLSHGRGGLEGAQDEALDLLAERHGFEVFHPEQHSVELQLKEMSSAEVVLGVEGSALHSLLLMEDPIATRFWALSRHRGGSGVFEHIRAAKALQYETINFLRHRIGGARGSIDMDIDALDLALTATAGLTRDLHVLDDRVEHPATTQTSYGAHIANTQVGLSRLEGDLAEALLALRGRDHGTAAAAISWYL